MFLQYHFFVITSNCENRSESYDLLLNGRDSECHKGVVSDSEVQMADEVSKVTEVRLVREINDELDEVSEVVYDEVCQVREADE